MTPEEMSAIEREFARLYPEIFLNESDKETQKPGGERPGQKARASGQYEIRGLHGGLTGQERTVVKGESLPPTPLPGQRYHLVDPTRNRSGQG